ncbi:NAD-dependent deacylase [Planctomycetota bacterium]|nr:NAD-dependent deacylase [Planctomycetota bacterium]
MQIAARSEVVEAAAQLARCQRLLVLTGAGSSADAGVPTFRGEGGLWNDRRVEELASPEGFANDRDGVWTWYRERRLQVASCQPHPGQRALALLQRHLTQPNQVLMATTNEDDLLDRAGVKGVVHLHGSLFDTQCSAECGWIARDDADNALSFLPCPECGAPSRPGSVWYGETVPRSGLSKIAAFDPDGCLVVGLSCLVQPVAGIPPELVNHGCPVVEINPSETPISPVVLTSIRSTAKHVLPILVDLLTSHTVRDQTRRLT